MHRKAALGWLTGLIMAVALIAVGCGGGDGGGGDDVTPPPTGTATLNGQVVAANDTSLLLTNADVTIEPVGQTAAAQAGGRTVTTGPDGGFAFTGLSAGEWTMRVTTPQSEEYGTGTARVPLVAGRTTTVSVAVLPLDTAAPQTIVLDPTSSTIDVGGRIGYRAQVEGPDGTVLRGIEPTWVVEGGIGSVNPEGIFTAQTVGSGKVRAFAGSAERASNVVVVNPRPPQVSSFRVNPQSLPATGGEIFISAAIRDGDGVQLQDVNAVILPAGGQPIEVDLDVTNPETAIRCPGVPNCFVDASFGVKYQVPANDNAPTADGVQAEENYAVSIRVRDRSGMTTESEFLEFVVQGIDPPPARPGI